VIREFGYSLLKCSVKKTIEIRDSLFDQPRAEGQAKALEEESHAKAQRRQDFEEFLCNAKVQNLVFLRGFRRRFW